MIQVMEMMKMMMRIVKSAIGLVFVVLLAPLWVPYISLAMAYFLYEDDKWFWEVFY